MSYTFGSWEKYDPGVIFFPWDTSGVIFFPWEPLGVTFFLWDPSGITYFPWDPSAVKFFPWDTWAPGVKFFFHDLIWGHILPMIQTFFGLFWLICKLNQNINWLSFGLKVVSLDRDVIAKFVCWKLDLTFEYLSIPNVLQYWANSFIFHESCIIH